MNESPHLLGKLLSQYQALQQQPVRVTTGRMLLIGDGSLIAVPVGCATYGAWRQRYAEFAPGSEPDRPALEYLAQGRVAWVVG